jgi:carboxymethylenebutenolidase
MRTRAIVAVLTTIVATTTVTAAKAPTLPPSEEDAKDRLNHSPRHGELVTVDVDGTPVHAWLVHPQRKDKAPVVLVIHEIFGLTDWIRAVADQLAAAGFIAIAPDLLSGKGPNGGGTDAFASRDDVTKAVSGLDRQEVMKRLDAVRTYAIALPSSDGHSMAIGFCWGGTTTFAYASAQPRLNGAVVYYGTAPEDEAALERLRVTVLGFYGEQDARVGATIEPTRAAMARSGSPALRATCRAPDTGSCAPRVADGANHGRARPHGRRRIPAATARSASLNGSGVEPHPKEPDDLVERRPRRLPFPIDQVRGHDAVRVLHPRLRVRRRIRQHAPHESIPERGFVGGEPLRPAERIARESVREHGEVLALHPLLHARELVGRDVHAAATAARQRRPREDRRPHRGPEHQSTARSCR